MSTDHPKELREGRGAHGLDAVMISDPKLAVTDRFGLRNLGAHSAPPGDDTEALPVPASLLIDAAGKVVWIEKSDNYQRRSPPEIVLAALERYLD